MTTERLKELLRESDVITIEIDCGDAAVVGLPSIIGVVASFIGPDGNKHSAPLCVEEVASSSVADCLPVVVRALKVGLLSGFFFAFFWCMWVIPAHPQIVA